LEGVEFYARLGLKHGSIVPTIEAGDAMSREEALKALASTIKHIQTGGELQEIEIRRPR